MAKDFLYPNFLVRRDFLKGLLIVLGSLGLNLNCLPLQAEGALKIGEAPPRADLLDLKGQKVSLPGDFKGQVGLLHFWASWCPYCRKEIMAIESLFQQFKNKGFRPFSINVGENPVAIEAYLVNLKVSYSIPLDADSVAAKRYRITGIPTTLIVDRGGLIRFKILGEINQAGLHKLVSTLMAK
jgi:cytochrome c biogenesis protein CcmG, thiol:disulfide interchange protein DsbE